VKLGSVVVPASPVHMEKLKAEPVAKAKAKPMSDTVQRYAHRSLDVTGDTTIHCCGGKQ